MKLPSWKDSFIIGTSPEVREAWKKFFLAFPDFVAYHDFQDDLDVQKEKLDVVIVEKNFCGKIRSNEIKTGSERVHKNYYTWQHGIVFEDISNIEERKFNSSIWLCNADLYTYGFYLDNRITDASIFYTPKIWKYLANNYKSIPKYKTDTDGLYHTQFMLPKVEDIPEECFYQSKKFMVEKMLPTFHREKEEPKKLEEVFHN